MDVQWRDTVRKASWMDIRLPRLTAASMRGYILSSDRPILHQAFIYYMDADRRVQLDNIQCVKLMLQHSADPTQECPISGQTMAEYIIHSYTAVSETSIFRIDL